MFVVVLLTVGIAGACMGSALKSALEWFDGRRPAADHGQELARLQRRELLAKNAIIWGLPWGFSMWALLFAATGWQNTTVV